MNTSLITSIFPHAIAVALSPMPIAALILVLLSTRARINSVTFLGGWFVALIVNVGVFMFLVQSDGAAHTKTTVISWIQAILGITLLVFALKQWHMRPKLGKKPITPKWMQAIDSFTPFKSFLMAAALVTVNAKNTILNVETGVVIGREATNFLQGFTTVIIFALIGSCTIAVPVFAFLLLGNRLEKTLGKLKTWFIFNSALILSILFFLLGLSLLAKAVGI